MTDNFLTLNATKSVRNVNNKE